jgi:hypothetical protein
MRLTGAHRCSDLLEATVCDRTYAVAQRADEFVSADPNQRVIGAQVLLDRGGDVTQQRIAGAVTLTVVRLLEAVDIDIREDQMSVSVARAVDLTLEQQQPDLTAERAGELIELGASQVSSAQVVIAIRAGAIFDRRFTISGRVRAVSGAFAAVDGALIRGRLIKVVVSHGLVSVSGGAVPVHGRLISIRRPLLGRRLRLITIGGIIVAIIRGALAVIGGVLTVRDSPVSFARCPAKLRCRARLIIAGPAVLERLALGRGLV